MFNAIQKKLAPFSRLSNDALLGTNGFFYVFGVGVSECMFVDGQITVRPKKETILHIGGSKNETINQKKLLDLLVRKAATTLLIKYDFNVTDISLSIAKWTLLNKKIKELNATHIQFEGDGKELRIYPFDIRAVVGSSAMRQSYIIAANGLYLKRSQDVFQFTTLADAWLKLPIGTSSLQLSECGVLRMEYTDTGIKVNMRDQKIRRPHTAFYSERLKKRILFLFHPKKGTLVREDMPNSIGE